MRSECSTKLTILLLFITAPAAAQTAVSGSGSITGAVRDAATGEPIAQSAVSLHRQYTVLCDWRLTRVWLMREIGGERLGAADR